MALDIDTGGLSKNDFKSLLEASSSDDDGPVQVKRCQFKKRLNLSDDEDDNLDTSNLISSPNAKDKSESSEEEKNNDIATVGKKKSKRRIVSKNSDESEESESEKKKSSEDFEEDNFGSQQRKILASLKADNGYDAESSEDEASNTGRSSRSSNQSEEENEKQTKSKAALLKPRMNRKSAIACRAAMQKERLKMISESQRMVRESQASLPYHKPRQRSLKEFLSARPKPSIELRGAKVGNVNITLIGEDFENAEKQVEDFYKPASEEEEDNFTPPISPKKAANSESTATSGATVVDKVLKVLLHTREELEKNILAQADTDSKPDEKSELNIERESITNSGPPLQENERNSNDFMEAVPVPTDDALCETSTTGKSADMMDTDNINEASENFNIESAPEAMETEEDKEQHPGSAAKESIVEMMETEKNSEEISGLGNSECDMEIDEKSKTETCVNVNTNSVSNTSESLTVSDNNSMEVTKSVTIPSVKSNLFSKISLSTEMTDACLTPSDAMKESEIFIKPATKTNTTEQNNDEIEDTIDSEDIHLYYEDSEDTVKAITEEDTSCNKETVSEKENTSPEKIDKPAKPSLDLEALYNSKDMLGSDEEEEKPKPKPKLSRKAELLARLKLSGGPVRLSGGPGDIIDLDATSEPKSGMDDLMQRFIRQASSGTKKKCVEKEGFLKIMQTGEHLDDPTDNKTKPGEKMNLLKSELRQSIAKQRDEEFKRRQKEYRMYENEEEGMLGDDECKVLTDEEEEQVQEEEGEESEGSTETEPELEDDVVLRDDPKPRSAFMDDEAEESEHEGDEEVVENDEEDGAEAEDEDEEDDDPEDPASDCDLDKNEVETTPAEGKKTFQRIKLVEDSDDEDASKDQAKVAESDRTKNDDMLNDDNKNDRFNSSLFNKSLDLSMLEATEYDHAVPKNKNAAVYGENTGKVHTAAAKLFPVGLTQLIEESNSQSNVFNSNLKTDSEGKPPRTFMKGLSELFQSTESLTSNLGDLCSGQFSTQTQDPSAPSGLEKLIQPMDSCPDNLADLCSGQFQTQVNMSQTQEKTSEINKLIGNADTQSQDLADLCSGQFMTQKTQNGFSELHRLVGDSDTVPDNLGELCSGQFVTQSQAGVSSELKKLINGSSTIPDDLGELCSGQFVTQSQAGVSSELKKLINGSSTIPDDLGELCSGQFVTQSQAGVSSELKKLINGSSTIPDDLGELCSGQFVTQKDTQELMKETKDVKETTSNTLTKNEVDSKDECVDGGCMRIVSDDEDEEPEAAPTTRKGKKKLAFSDDEDDGQDNDDAASDVAEESDDDAPLGHEESYVDYDSEENEILVSAAPQEHVKPKSFFDAEAELSESEWGSADEDERGLDQLEEELGDKEQFDDDAVKEALGKIHARRMLDEDKQDVRLFQEAFLEDGDLHSEGGGRQRLFRWKNIDDGEWVGGTNPNLEGDEVADDEMIEESTWRKARLEREIWLKENTGNIETMEEENSKLLNLGRSMLAKMGNNKSKPGNSKPSSIVKPTAQSPGKTIMQSLKRSSGSFLARRTISVSRMVAMTGGEGEAATIVNTSSNRNFVFTTLSPASSKFAGEGVKANDEQDQPVPSKKRAAAKKPAGKQPAPKKQKVNSSVFQLL